MKNLERAIDMVARFPLIIVLALMFCPTAFASSDPILEDYRIVSPSGKYYAVVRRLGGPAHEWPSGPVEVLIVENRLGPPPKPARGLVKRISAKKYFLGRAFVVLASVGIRDGDRILGRVREKDGPRKILFDDKRKSVVFVDEHGMNQRVLGGEPCLRRFTLSGKVRSSLKLEDLFSKTVLTRFEESSAGIFWMEDTWLNPETGEVVLILPGENEEDFRLATRIKVVDATGTNKRIGEAKDILAALKECRDPNTLQLLITLAAENNLVEAVPLLEKTVTTGTFKRLKAPIKTALEKLK